MLPPQRFAADEESCMAGFFFAFFFDRWEKLQNHSGNQE